MERLTANVPLEPASRTPEQHARWLLAQMLDWHRREHKSEWWEYFRLAELPAEDLVDERDALAGLVFREKVGGTARAPVHRYDFPPQEVRLRAGDSLHTFGGEKFGKIDAISLDDRTVDIKKRQDTAGVHPDAVFAYDLVGTKVIEEALLRLGAEAASEGVSGSRRYGAACDLLMRTPPRLQAGESLRLASESPVEAAVRIAPRLAGGVLAIQGPPGAGKTYTAARMICELVRAGKRVGITANSHTVIRNLLEEVIKASDSCGMNFLCLQKVSDPVEAVPRIEFSTSNERVIAALQSCECAVAAGTAWFWSREAAERAVDALFVDEAAQMSLTNVVAVSQACRSLVLLGDPQQLEQPTQGSHPEGTDVSALHHLLSGKATIGESEGLFLDVTWRLHPEICAFTSEIFYEGRLRSRPGLELMRVQSVGPLNGTGLRYVPVPHGGTRALRPRRWRKSSSS
jgi:uncharacterized protein